MKHAFHRGSLLLGVASLCMLPIGCVIDAKEWGSPSEHHYSGYFTLAWWCAILNHFTRPS